MRRGRRRGYESDRLVRGVVCLIGADWHLPWQVDRRRAQPMSLFDIVWLVVLIGLCTALVVMFVNHTLNEGDE